MVEVAAPIFDGRQEVRAALVVSAPLYRADEMDVTDVFKQSADEISRHLGHIGS